MSEPPLRGLFVTGTDTGVGKTYVTSRLASALIQRGHSIGVYKPVCSGAEPGHDSTSPVWSDVEQLSAAVGHRFPREWICPQTFRAPLAPPLAAGLEGRTVDSGQLRRGIEVWRGRVDLLLVEGVGGWLCPLTSEETIADLAQDLGFPVLVVAANRLGTINHTLLTLQSIQFSQLKTLAAVVNYVREDEDGTEELNASTLRQWTNVPVVGPFPHGQSSAALIENPSAAMEELLACLEQASLIPSR